MSLIILGESAVTGSFTAQEHTASIKTATMNIKTFFHSDLIYLENRDLKIGFLTIGRLCIYVIYVINGTV